MLRTFIPYQKSRSVCSCQIALASVRGTGTIDFYRNTLLPDGPFSPLRAALFGGDLRVDPGGMTLNQNGSARIDSYTVPNIWPRD